MDISKELINPIFTLNEQQIQEFKIRIEMVQKQFVKYISMLINVY